MFELPAEVLLWEGTVCSIPSSFHCDRSGHQYLQRRPRHLELNQLSQWHLGRKEVISSGPTPYEGWRRRFDNFDGIQAAPTQCDMRPVTGANRASRELTSKIGNR